MKKIIDDFIEMNITGRVLELCEKYYDENVIMTNNGTIFAKSMKESYEKQKGYLALVKEFDVKLLSSKIEGNISELVFHYKITTLESNINEFSGKHIQTWVNEKITKEEYFSIE